MIEHVQKHLANVVDVQRGCCGHGLCCAQSPSTDSDADCNGVDFEFVKFVDCCVSVVGYSEDVVVCVSIVDDND